MSGSYSNSKPVTTTSVLNRDQRVGVEGTGNLIQGEGSRFQDTSQTSSYSISPSISSDGGDVFAPIFSGGGSSGGGEANWLTRSNAAKAIAENPGLFGFLPEYLSQNGDNRTPEQWLYDDLTAGDPNGSFIAAVKSAGGFGQTPASNSGGDQVAQQVNGENSFAVSGSINGPVASGNDSVAIQQSQGGIANTGSVSAPIITGNGGNGGAPILATGDGGDLNAQVVTAPVSGSVVGGDVNAPIISAPVSGPLTVIGGDAEAPIFNASNSGIQSTGNDSVVQTFAAPVGVVGGGDIEVSAPIINGNSGSVSITTSDPIIVKAAIDANLSTSSLALSFAKNALDSNRLTSESALDAARTSLNSSLSFADKALAAVAESRKDPNERVTTDTLKTVLYIAAGLGALVALRS